MVSPKKWIESTNAIGMWSKSGKYGGTFAHVKYLNKMAIEQMKSLKDSAAAHRLNEMVSIPVLKEADSEDK